jgi:hypothetical protein
MVLAAGPDLIEDVRKAPENVLSTEPMTEVRIVWTEHAEPSSHQDYNSSFNQNTRWTYWI